MSKKVSMKDFYSSEEMTAILTYAYLKHKEQEGYPLTADEKDLLYGESHTTFLSMAFNNNYYYPCISSKQGLRTALNLEAFVKCIIAYKMSSYGEQSLFVECDIQHIMQEALAMIPQGFAEPDYTRTVQYNAVKFSEDKLVLVARINTEFGTIVKGYVYIPPTMERFRKYYPDFILDIEHRLYLEQPYGFLGNYNYAIGRTLFDNDFEPLFYGVLCDVPQEMRDAVARDYKSFLKQNVI
ncbi:MAG: hypothetical protein NC548_36440 [Lachnospiraceae bacterium]|nr:hypothetical protein [Lachnospiraceae bacterium]MCM1230381.1 hypothetical protein [Ruminococcus flavefaciens]